MSKDDEWGKFWEHQSQEARTGEGGVNPVQEEGWIYLAFVSQSNGRGRRPRRRPRDVEMARNLETGRTVVLKDIPTGGLDTIAQALFGHIGQEVNPWEVFLVWLKKSKPENGSGRSRKSKRKKKEKN